MNEKFIELTEAQGGKKVIVNISQLLIVFEKENGCALALNSFDGYLSVTEPYSHIIKYFN